MPHELQHHGIKGQKWGVRRYQYADGSLTPAGKQRYNGNGSAVKGTATYAVKYTRTQITGKQYVDGYLKQGTTLSRIQTKENFENFAFYATYKQQDSDKYMGLFGKNLVSRAQAEAKKAEKKAAESGSESDILEARELRSKADGMKVYQLKIESTKNLKIPSDENAGHITTELLKKDPEFRKNVEASIQDSKEKMLRPTQQILFSQAQTALAKDINKLSPSDKVAIYKALNLSLVNHNPQEIAAQDRFYGELKKKGYSALLDYNDKEFSSYHAKRPVIVFDLDTVKLQSVTETNPQIVNSLYRKYNAERIVKEIPANTVGLVSKMSGKKVSECRSYINGRMNDYLNR